MTRMSLLCHHCYYSGWLRLWLLLLLCSAAVVHGCTDLLVTPGASQDGAAMIAYNADAPQLFGYLYHYPASSNNNNNNNNNSNSSAADADVRKIYDWDSGVYLGEIPEVSNTYNVVGNGNEYGLVIGETTFGGVPLLAWNQTGAILDYGSLIYITLQRAQTAREAIAVMATLLDTHGYYSGGESFSIADSITGDGSWTRPKPFGSRIKWTTGPTFVTPMPIRCCRKSCTPCKKIS